MKTTIEKEMQELINTVPDDHETHTLCLIVQRKGFYVVVKGKRFDNEVL